MVYELIPLHRSLAILRAPFNYLLAFLLIMLESFFCFKCRFAIRKATFKWWCLNCINCLFLRGSRL